MQALDIKRSPSQFERSPLLPAMDDPVVCVLQPDIMQVNTRKNYIHDRMRTTLIYISEYDKMTENRYRNEDLLVRLRAVFGHVNKIQDQIDRALQQDDAHQRRGNMRLIVLPTRFHSPEVMGQGDINVWTNWVREETNTVMTQLE